MSLNDELIAIKLELKGQREAISGLHSVDKAQKGIGTSTAAAGTAAATAEKKTSRLSRAYASLGKAARWGIGFLGVGGAFALKQAIENTAELSKTTSGLTRNFGLQTNVASRWATVAHARDIDSKALSTTFSVLSSKMVDAARKGGTALTPFHQLGISQEELVKHSNDAEWGLMRVTQALGEEAGGAKRSAAAKGALGKGFQTLVPLMSEGTKGLKEQLRWADKYGSLLDTKTNDSIMEMVTAQRENKAAMFGLQVQIAKHFAPAIVDASDVFQRFVAMLNSDDLTADQKIHRIEQQFLGIEDTLIQIISDALPRVAEHGGELGVKLAGAVWRGFQNSDLAGKLFIGFWLFHALGGPSALGRLGARAGGKLATAFGWKFLETVAPYFAAETGVEGLGSALGSQMGGLKTLFAAEGALLGTAMGAAAAGALAAEIYFAVKWQKEHKLFDLLDLINPQSTDSTSIEEEAQRLTGLGYTHIGFASGHELEAVDPKGHHITEVFKGNRWVRHRDGTAGKAPSRHKRNDTRASSSSIEVPRLPRESLANFVGGGGRPIVMHSHIHLDGKEIAEVVAHHVGAAEALS